MINYIFSTHLQLSNGKRLSLQQETRPYVGGFPLGCCDQSALCVVVITEALGERSLVTGRLKEVGCQKTIQLENSMKSLSIESIGNSFMWVFWQSHSQANLPGAISSAVWSSDCILPL
jgi:hypothetical protein